MSRQITRVAIIVVSVVIGFAGGILTMLTADLLWPESSGTYKHAYNEGYDAGYSIDHDDAFALGYVQGTYDDAVQFDIYLKASGRFIRAWEADMAHLFINKPYWGRLMDAIIRDSTIKSDRFGI